ncbi:hypothetical protein QLG07_05355 [Erwinia sp. V90_4]|uniref:hypothetical protein n=1 Tax=Erwinia sp. V90_4 TaxID=3044239 RepID=UPI00249F4587|nr:hypothetical protein [Erwinia sp. V90_4]MDI3438868.1 hypothetical protein [Erwinia sp. V90_4]
MKLTEYTVMVFFCCLIFLFAFLAISSVQSEGGGLKTYVLMSMPLFLWMIYQCVTVMTEKARTRESDEVTFMRMAEQVRQYEKTERVAGGRRLLKGILECREVARAIRQPECEDASLTLSRVAYIERLMNALVPGLCRKMPEGEIQMWMRMLNEPAPGEGAAGERRNERPATQGGSGEEREGLRLVSGDAEWVEGGKS